MNLIALQSKTTEDFARNLLNLIFHIKNTSKNSLIVAHELVITGYSYDDFEAALEISNQAIQQLIELSTNKIISLTLLTKQGSSFYNTLHIFYNNELIHTQSKHKLFLLSDEGKYFSSGNEDDIKLIEVDGLKIGILICFELRFTELWGKLRGADVILIPSMWGKPRKEHLETLSKALAIANQCYVVVSNSSNEDMANGSGIIDPFGNETRDDAKEVVSTKFDAEQIKKIRRYINMGIK